jgi:hypothetical protein
MTLDEFKTLVKAMKSIWTQDSFIPDEYSLKIWYELLKDIPYADLNVAIQAHAMQCKWAPSVAELRERALMSKVGILHWSEGWEQVIKAIGSYGHTREEEALASMDNQVAVVVKRLGWQNICRADSHDLSTIRANFRMIFESMSEETKGNYMLPDRLQNQLRRLRLEGVSE